LDKYISTIASETSHFDYQIYFVFADIFY